jgi:hypothetical protein
LTVSAVTVLVVLVSAQTGHAQIQKRADRDWWALQPVERPDPPTVQNEAWITNDIDRFVLARLEEKRLEPSVPANRRTLIRRLSFDLIGLPPEPETVDQFLEDESPQAYERLVDELLSSPHHGERWARHWLDVVRFGETQGYERNHIRDNAWRYRDWVIDAFNRDLPYDDFVRHQIAGDALLPGNFDALMATGYHVCGTWDQVAHLEGSASMKKSAREDTIEDLVATLGQTFLGLTVNCARCHEHKFDPISQKEYYQVAALIGGVAQQPGERQNIVVSNDPKRETELRSLLEILRPRLSALEERLGLKVDSEAPDNETTEILEKKLARASEEEQRQYRELREQIARVDGELAQVSYSVAAHVIIPVQPPVFHVLARGDPHAPREAVSPEGLSALSRSGLTGDFGLAPDAPEAQRRVKLAQWLTDRRNPLTARVFVNRIWHYHFGIGLVDTPSDFGFNGGRPSHPQLLDWLAYEFMESGWKIKELHRKIVTSSTYRQTSQSRIQDAEPIDADNRLIWRFNTRRLEGEALRDSTLAIAGALNRKIGGPSYVDMKIDRGQNHAFTDPTGEFSDAVNRRTIYRLWARSGSNPMLTALDCPDPTVMTPRRTRTITPVQALSLLNNPFMENCSQRFAARLEREAGDTITNRIDLAYRMAFSRAPTTKESRIAEAFMREHGLVQFCLVLFNTNEFLFVN